MTLRTLTLALTSLLASQALAHEPLRVLYDQKCSTRDGVKLSSDVYLPTAPGRYPVILVRSPYNKVSDRVLDKARYFTSKGYAYVYQDVRGRGDSDGVFVPYRNEGRDGYDAIEWAAAQPWSNGKVGTLGGSYLGRAQWLAALQRPPHLITMVALVTPSNPFVEWPTGVPIPMHLSWLHYVSGRINQNIKGVNWSQLYHHLPLIDMDDASGRPIPTWDEEIRHSGLSAWWDPIRYQNRYEQVGVPVLHISGWYDDEQVGTPLNFANMRKRGGTAHARANQRLLMGPWPHRVNSTSKLAEVDFGKNAIIDLKDYQRRWFDLWLKGLDDGIGAEPPVRIFVMGDNRWRDENEWPLARAKPTKYYLHSRGRANSRFGNGLLSRRSPRKEPADSYRYDPADPVPFITDPEFSQIGSADDYRAVERRDDVLVYTSEPLKQRLEVTGPLTMVLYASSSAPDTDFTAKLLDVWPNGYAQRLSDGLVRARYRRGLDREVFLKPGNIYRFEIDLWNTSQAFLPGHRIRVEIASSAFPKYDRNLNTNAPLGRSTQMRIAKQRVLHTGRYPSHMLLPVIPNAESRVSR